MISVLRLISKPPINTYYPDIRTIMNNLQLASMSGELNLKACIEVNLSPKNLTPLILKGKFRTLREKWAGLSEFIFIYKYLFDTFIYEVDKHKRADIALIIAEYMFKDSQVVDREINVSACIVEIMLSLEIIVEF